MNTQFSVQSGTRKRRAQSAPSFDVMCEMTYHEFTQAMEGSILANNDVALRGVWDYAQQHQYLVVKRDPQWKNIHADIIEGGEYMNNEDHYMFYLYGTFPIRNMARSVYDRLHHKAWELHDGLWRLACVHHAFRTIPTWTPMLNVGMVYTPAVVTGTLLFVGEEPTDWDSTSEVSDYQTTSDMDDFMEYLLDVILPE